MVVSGEVWVGSILSRGRLFAGWFTALLVSVLVLGLVQPGGVAAAAESDPEPDCDVVAAATETRALWLAAECGHEVMVAPETSEYGDLVARPDGRVRAGAHVEPVRARNDGSGDWADIDTTLRRRGDGSIGPVNTVLPVEISGGGEGAFGRVDRGGKRFALSWPEALPEPALSGATATYAEVLPGVDLTVTATATGFSHNLVVKTREAARNPALSRVSLGLELDGVSAAATSGGGVAVTDSSGEALVVAPQPLMWESTPAAGARARAAGSSVEPDVAEVGVEVDADAVTLVPDAEMLAAEDTVFPVVIDPLWTGGKQDGVYATASEKSENTAYWKSSHLTNVRDFGNVGAGRTCDSWTDFTCHTPSYRMRTFFRMDTAKVTEHPNRIVSSATFKLRQEHAWVCQNQEPKSKARIWRTSTFSTDTSWSNQPWWSPQYATSEQNANYSAACEGGPGWVSFDAANMVKTAQDQDASFLSIGMRAINESTVAQWKRYDTSSATINIWYATRPLVPVGRSADGKGCGSEASPVWVRNKSPYLQAQMRDSDGWARAHFQIFDGATVVDAHTSGNVSSGTNVKWTTSKTLYEKQYRWRVRAEDDHSSSDWASWCSFRVDSKPPAKPQIEQLTPVEDVDANREVRLRFTSSDANGITRFEYGLDREARENSVTAGNGSAEITWSNLTVGRHVIHVWARDPAGHVSEPGKLTFFVGSEFPDTPVGAWRMDGDLLDDSGEGHPLTLSSGVTPAADRDGRANSALGFDGTSGACASAEQSGLRTDKEYTVATWARVSAGGGSHQVVLSQSGDRSAVFSLLYVRDTSKWQMVVSSGDVAAPMWRSVNAAETTPVGEWAHIAATVDPSADVLRLYVNGELSASAALDGELWHAAGPLLVGCSGNDAGQRNEFTGDVDHVGVWQGLLSQGEIQRAMTELPAGLVGSWELAGSGADATTFARDITPAGGYAWGTGPYGRSNGALTLDGAAGSCASTDGAVLRTDESFTVSAWAKLAGDGTAGQSVLAQAGTTTSGFFLGWDQAANRWTMLLRDSDRNTPGWAQADSNGAVQQDSWTHLVGVYDKTDGKVRLYIGGELHDEVDAVGAFDAGGSLHVGCGVRQNGTPGTWAKGSIAGAAAMRGAATTEQIGHLHGNPPVKVQGEWPLNGPESSDPNPSELTDVSDNGHDLTINGDYAWADDRAFEEEGSLSLQLSEGSCAETAGPVVRTDASFTVAAWVQLGADRSGPRAVVSQSGANTAGFALGYEASSDRWAFVMPATDTASAATAAVRSTVAPDADPEEWVHLAGVYDVHYGKIHLYVDGEHQGSANGPTTPWQANGPLLVGCMTAGGQRAAQWGSTLDEVRAWSSTVDPHEIDAISNY